MHRRSLERLSHLARWFVSEILSVCRSNAKFLSISFNEKQFVNNFLLPITMILLGWTSSPLYGAIEYLMPIAPPIRIYTQPQYTHIFCTMEGSVCKSRSNSRLGLICTSCNTVSVFQLAACFDRYKGKTVVGCTQVRTQGAELYVNHFLHCLTSYIYRVIENDCRGFNNLSHTIHLRYEYVYFFI